MSTMIPDPDRADAWLIGSASKPHDGVAVGATVLHNVHTPDRCASTHCLVHNPSDHHMRGWRLHWRGDRRLMERVCPDHGVGHPDPDDLAYHLVRGQTWQGVHGCCGCCTTTERAVS